MDEEVTDTPRWWNSQWDVRSEQILDVFFDTFDYRDRSTKDGRITSA